MRSWGFYFSATPDELVGEGEIRVNTAPPYVGQSAGPNPHTCSLTRVYVDNLDRDGQYIRPMIDANPAGTVIYIEGAGGTFAHLKLLRAPIRRVGYLELAVTTLDATPTGIAPGPVTAAFLSPASSAPGPRAAADPLLVTLAEAKEHLAITDDLHDALVTQKLTSASATIRDYLKDQNDPTWDDTTAPPWIREAVFLLLGHLYQHRGDEFGPANDNDDRVWTAIANLTRRSRDPALA
jgi:hypothetical protein